MRRVVLGLVLLIFFGALGGYMAGAVTRAPRTATADGSLASVVVIRSDRQPAVDVSTSAPVESARFRLTVPNGHRDLFDVRFSGVAAFPGGAAFPVAIDVTIDGIVMPPSSLPAWPSGAATTVPFQIERALGPLAPGTYDVGIQLMGNTNDHRLVQLLGWTLLSQRTSQRASAAASPPTESPRATMNA